MYNFLYLLNCLTVILIVRTMNRMMVGRLLRRLMKMIMTTLIDAISFLLSLIGINRN